MKKFEGLIYKIINLVNGKCYIGQTTNFKKRKYFHLYRAKKNADNMYIHNALRKYGIENFKWVVLCKCDNKTILDIMETFKIMVEHSHWSEGGYNLNWGGSGNNGTHMSEKTKEIHRKRTKGKRWEEIFGEEITKIRKDKYSKYFAGKNNPFYGKHHKIETIQRISQKNKKYSDDVVKKVIYYRESGMKYKEISTLVGIPQTTLNEWCKKVVKKYTEHDVEIFMEYKQKGLPYQEISNIMKIPIGTLSWWYSKRKN